MSVLSSLVVGAVIGAKHSFEADHLAAISTLTREDDRNPAYVGASWGIGHSAVILTVGILFLLSGIELPEAVSTMFEIAAAGVLVYLGVRTLMRLTENVDIKKHSHTHEGDQDHPHAELDDESSHVDRDGHTEGDGHSDGHSHNGGQSHSHSGEHRHLELFGVEVGLGHTHVHRDSFYVGILHGFAGSGAAVLLLATSAKTLGTGFGYLISFCVATILAMGFFAAVWGRLIKKKKVENYLLGAAGIASISVGILIILEVAGLHPGI
ncbi:MAG: hypothetical protein ABEK59_12840 [Halobacteria archaeon]